MPCAIDTRGAATAVNGTNLALVADLIAEGREFVDKVYLPDLLAIARFYKDWASKGEGRVTSCPSGISPSTTSPTPRTSFPRGAILGRDLSQVLEVDLNDVNQIQELVSHSWYDYSTGKDTPLHPYDGETRPHYTGPPLPYSQLDLDAEYSWVKSPRW